jgi:repressor LexA
MAEPLTPTERRVYHYLLDFLSENTYQPSIREIGKRFRIKSTKTVSDILQALAEKGYIERDPSRSRGVRLLGFAASARIQPVPIYVRIAPSEPALLPEHRQGFLTVDRRFVPGDDVYAIRIKGNGMEGRGILDGDFALVNPSARARDGEIVAARIGEDTTVRTLTHRGAAIVLEPASSNDREITVGPQDNFAVLGVICGVFRPFHDGKREDDGIGLAEAELEEEAVRA